MTPLEWFAVVVACVVLLVLAFLLVSAGFRRDQ